jgi:hypothetical protein
MDTVTWTDDKIDVLDGKVDALDTKVEALDTRVGVLEKKVDVLDTKVDERFKAVNQQLGDLRVGQAQLIDRFDAMQRTLVQVGFSLVVGLLAALVALFAVVLTH